MSNLHKIIKIKNDNFNTNFQFIDSNRNKHALAVDKIDFGLFDTPFGRALIMKNERGICGLAFASEFGQKFALQDLIKPLVIYNIFSHLLKINIITNYYYRI